MNEYDKREKARRAGEQGYPQPNYDRDSTPWSRRQQDDAFKQGEETREWKEKNYKAWQETFGYRSSENFDTNHIDYSEPAREPEKPYDPNELTPLEKKLSLDKFLSIAIILFNIYVMAMGTSTQKTFCIILSVVALIAIYIFIAKGYKK